MRLAFVKEEVLLNIAMILKYFTFGVGVITQGQEGMDTLIFYIYVGFALFVMNKILISLFGRGLEK